jgi:hypothetical protein
VKAGPVFKPAFFLLLALLVIVNGCGKKDSADATPSGSPGTPRRNPAGIDRYQWNLNTLVDPYLQRGHRDPDWDEPATNALAKFAAIRGDAGNMDEGDHSIILSYLREAVLKGCSDPMILYLHTRYVLAAQEGVTDTLIADSHKRSAGNLHQYPCASIRHFYVALRTSEAINKATGGRATSPEVHQFRRVAMSKLHESLQDPDIPPIEAYEACRDMFAALGRNAMVPEFYRHLEPILLKNWPNEPFIYQIKGHFHLDEAWKSRGSGYSDSVTEKGWEGFKDHLNTAAEALEKAWKLGPTNPQIALEMIRVELGQAQGRERMELWFNRAMALNTNYYEPCKSKLNYLEPKWHGSAADMLAFARECTASEKWGGNVPLLAIDAHYTLGTYAEKQGNTNYWKNPRVWSDLQSAFEKFFTLNTNAVGWRHTYANYAYKCEQWGDFNKQLPLFTWGTNYDYFGGRATFDQMVQIARARLSDSK